MSFIYKINEIGVNESLLNELGTHKFLNKITPKAPLLLNYKLIKLSLEQRKKHFLELASIKNSYSEETINELFKIINNLLPIDSIILSLKSETEGLVEYNLIYEYLVKVNIVYKLLGLKEDYNFLNSITVILAKEFKKGSLANQEIQALNLKLKELTYVESETRLLLETQIQTKVSQLHLQIRKNLASYSLELEKFNLKFKKLMFQFYLVSCLNTFKLCLPQEGQYLSIIEGRLSSIEHLKTYIPLNIKTAKTNLILGANASGKTTILKTICHLFILANLGIPVPANELVLPDFSNIAIHLRNSGSVLENKSAFTAELDFFKEPNNNSLYLADELFLSTEPVGGAQLASILLETFKENNWYLITCTHYIEPVYIKDIKHFIMQAGFIAQNLETNKLIDLLKKQKDETLKLASSFLPKNSSLKLKIDNFIYDSNNS